MIQFGEQSLRTRSSQYCSLSQVMEWLSSRCTVTDLAIHKASDKIERYSRQW